MTTIKLPPLPDPDTHRDDENPPDVWTHSAEQLRAHSLAVAEAVREECAQFCDAWASHCSAAIRAIKLENQK